MNIVLRSSAGSTSLIASAKEVIRRADPDLAMYEVRTMQERLGRLTFAARLSARATSRSLLNRARHGNVLT